MYSKCQFDSQIKFTFSTLNVHLMAQIFELAYDEIVNLSESQIDSYHQVSTWIFESSTKHRLVKVY